MSTSCGQSAAVLVNKISWYKMGLATEMASTSRKSRSLVCFIPSVGEPLRVEPDHAQRAETSSIFPALAVLRPCYRSGVGRAPLARRRPGSREFVRSTGFADSFVKILASSTFTPLSHGIVQSDWNKARDAGARRLCLVGSRSRRAHQTRSARL
eukprot:924194-Rhodomonas_salina.1